MSISNLLSDPVILMVINDIDSKLTKRKYENILVGEGLYSFENLREQYGLGDILNKQEFIRETLEGIHDENVIGFLEVLHENGLFSKETKQALAKEHIELGQTLAGELIDPVVERSLLETALIRHGMDQVQVFLDQSLENYNRENYEAANAMTRTALENMIEEIASIISSLRGNEPIPHNRTYISPFEYRNYLDNTGFLDQAEKKLLDSFYGYASTNGSHPGISSGAEARLRRFVAIGLALLFLEKLDNSQFMNSLV